MKLLILGANGGTGVQVVQRARSRGHQISVYLRNPDKLKSVMPDLDGVNIHQGEVDDAEAIARAVEGQDAIISCIGPNRKNPDVIMTTTANNLIAAMRKTGVRRLIWQTGAAVKDEDHDQPSFLQNLLVWVMRTFQPQVAEDCARVLTILRASDDIDWVMVRVPRLDDSPAKGDFQVMNKAPGPKGLSRADAADFLLQQLDSDKYLHKAPMIGY